MAVRVNRSLCNGCGDMAEPMCVAVCPGDLLYRDESNRCAVRDWRDCWDCAACVKECPRQAIEMFLPVQIGGRGSTLTARSGRGRITWKLTRPDGKEEIFEIINQTFNEVK
ncbi:MAG: 4Fe-4S binding protein [Pelotomaculum sp.]|uniref:Ferredoxin n=1 Tax=Pelotomaculum thermopropionicum (strain DSM 13744 / JCM 10971 / SI) TaxID=370438 RepID=A5D5R6_PELTS|nr:4Fe-4S binding protein [Pelotomaculum sp.]NPV74530.1 4Fe-4S binding protein [Pelotomaculum sp.]BAF58421.1 ferredoxin [Pelotomaculum thermopropionicum SI]